MFPSWKCFQVIFPNYSQLQLVHFFPISHFELFIMKVRFCQLRFPISYRWQKLVIKYSRLQLVLRLFSWAQQGSHFCARTVAHLCHMRCHMSHRCGWNWLCQKKTHRLLFASETACETFPSCWYAMLRSTRFRKFYQKWFYFHKMTTKIFDLDKNSSWYFSINGLSTLLDINTRHVSKAGPDAKQLHIN